MTTASILSAPTTRFEVKAVLHEEDGSIVPVERALAEAETWYRRYRETWLGSSGMAGVGRGGLAIEVWGLLWFATPHEEALSNVVYWLYALTELLRGAPTSTIAAWEESTMTARLEEAALVLEEVEPASGFVFFPQRKLAAEKFVARLLDECGLVTRFAGQLIALCGSAEAELAANVRRNVLGDLEDAVANLNRGLAAWTAGRGEA